MQLDFYYRYTYYQLPVQEKIRYEKKSIPHGCEKCRGGMGSSSKETPLPTALDTNESRDVWTESSSLKNCFFISDIPSLWSRNVRHCGHGALFFVHVTSVKAQRPNDEHEAL